MLELKTKGVPNVLELLTYLCITMLLFFFLQILHITCCIKINIPNNATNIKINYLSTYKCVVSFYLLKCRIKTNN
jgi:hypothetical protein